MPLNLLLDVLGVCGAPQWTATKDAVDLVVERNSVSFGTLRQLEADGIFAEKLSCPSTPKLQTDFNSGKPGEVLPNGTLRLRLPRIVNQCVVAKNLTDLLSISSASYKAPKAYFLFEVEDSARPFCYTEPTSLSAATPLIKRYHDALNLWDIVEKQAEHSVASNRHALFFGIRKTEIAPRFSAQDLAEDIAVGEIRGFTEDKDREETRKGIFHSVLSEFLQDQKVDRAFSYLLRQSSLFARRLKEGLAIYLSDHSPEKLAKEAQSKYLGLAETLERIVGGMEAKSLSIPAAVLLAVKEAEMGGKWTTLNVIIIIATALYVITMFIVFLSQRAMLNLLKATIAKTTKELKDQGLDETNPVLSDSFAKLEARWGHTQIGSRLTLAFSFIPLVAVIYAVFLASPPTRSSYIFQVTPANGVQIIQSTNSQAAPLTVKP